MKPLVSNIRFIVQSLPKGNHSFLDEEERFQEKLLRLSENTFSTHTSYLSSPLRALQEHVIKDCAVGPEHLAFLLDNNNVCRIAYKAATKSSSAAKVNQDVNKDNGKSGTRASKMIRTSSHSNWGNMDFLGVTGSGSLSRWGRRGGVVRSSGLSGATATTEASSARKTIRTSSNSNSSDSITSSGIRLIRASQVRGRNIPLFSGGQKVVVPASHVPEELINQVQNVLQGKSRSIILRELQRTHLDVNMAVNNLLSRDDEDNDDLEDAASDYIPGEELMSLLDGGMTPSDHARVVIDAESMLPEELLGYTFPSRAISSSGRRLDSDDPDESLTQIPTSQWSESKASSGKTTGPKESDLVLGDVLEWWTAGEEFLKFKLIGSMHSELVAVDSEGSLHQWKWSSSKPQPHPASNHLHLENEKISFLATSSILASVVTEEGAIATWMDGSVSAHSRSLDLPCTPVEMFRNEKVKSLSVCPLYSAVITAQDRVYWWGFPPYNQRKKLVEKSQNFLQQSLDKESAKQNLVVGDTVCLRSFPIYQSGAIAVNLSSGFPKVGQLLQSVWRADTKATFKILSCSAQEKSPKKCKKDDEAPADVEEECGKQEPKADLRKWKTLVDNSTSDAVHSGEMSRKRKRSDEDVEETWDLKDTVFVEDVRSLPLGRVVKTDGNILAVSFARDDPVKQQDPEKMFSDCRLLQRDDVIHVKSAAPKTADCMQRSPKRLTFDQRFHLLCITAGDGGITAMATHDRGRLSLLRISLTSGKITSQRRLPTKADSFFNKVGEGVKTSSTKLLSCGTTSPTLLQDCNSVLYPLLGDENGGIRDPIWADIPPLYSSGMGLCVDSHNVRSTVVVLAFRGQVLMPLIMSRDLLGFQSLLQTVENHQDASWVKVFYQGIVNERCDGQRNILHMCIEMSVPSSNKEQKEDEESQNKMATTSKRSSPSAASPGKASSSKGFTSEANSGSFLSDGDRISAVNAIASAISCVRGSSTSSSRETTTSSSSSGKHPPFQPIPTLFLPGRSEQSALSNVPRSSGEFLEKIASPPGSPIMMWPCDAAPQWRGENRDEEEGMNLTMNNSKKSNVTWTEVSPATRGSRHDAVAILQLICKSKCIQPYLKSLLCHKDSAGYTPFMFAVAHRAYPAALAIFKAAFSLAMDTPSPVEGSHKDRLNAPVDSPNQAELLSMLYPPGSDPDDNPMYMLCCNDTCSFTWTGALHINQDIFECLTCGLVETLCCCTECARVCHKGHECKLKRTSPTAYCDCWEKCACKSLVEGSVPDRTALLRVLLHTTDLYERHNSQGEHIIHFLAQTVARQREEQRQYRPPPRSTISRQNEDSRHSRPPPRTARMSAGSMRHRIAARAMPPGGDQDMPEHDLRPPQFCRDALLQLLSDWHAVRSLLFSGCKSRRDKMSVSSKLDGEDSISNLLPGDNDLLSGQSGTTRLDSFTHTIVVKCSSPEYLDRLLETLIHAVQVNKHRDHDDGVVMARRFLRSVIRVFIVLTAQSTPDKLAARLSLYNQSAISKCRRVFTALITLAIEELCETAESLIAPVRMGVTKPTSAYPLFSANVDIFQGSSAAFSKLPFPPRTHPSDDEDNDDVDKPSKRPARKSRKKPKKSKPHRMVAGTSESHSMDAARNQETGNDDESDHNMTSQDTQPVDEEPMEGLRQLFQDISGQIDVRNEDGDLVDEDESDMEITDVEVAPGSESDTADTDSNEQPNSFLEDRPSRDRESQHDDEDEDADVPQKIGRNEDEDTDSDHWREEVNLERKSTREQRAQAREAPHAMQWAMGARSMVPIKGPGSSGHNRPPIGGLGTSSSTGVIYVNSRSMRRNDGSMENAYLNSVLERQHGGRSKQEASSNLSTSTTNQQLSKLFSTCIREIVHLLDSLTSGSYMNASTLGTILEVSYQESSDLRDYVQEFLEATWKWLLVVIQSTESQLHYGQVLSMASSPSHPDHPQYKGGARRPRSNLRHHGNQATGEDATARQDFLTYVLSLLRSHSNEHADLLPVVDISSMKHIAYVLDAYIYYLRVLIRSDGEEGGVSTSGDRTPPLDIGYDNSENEEEEEDQMGFQDDLYSAALQSDCVKMPSPPNTFPDDCSTIAQPPSHFFHRSESMTFLGCSDSHSFHTPLSSAIPLAEKPHLLRPNSRKEELFGRPSNSDLLTHNRSYSLSLSTRTTSMAVSKPAPVEDRQGSSKSISLPPPVLSLPPEYSSLDASSKTSSAGAHVESDNSKDLVKGSSSSIEPPLPKEKSSTASGGAASSEDVESEMEIDNAVKHPHAGSRATAWAHPSEASQSKKKTEKEVVSAQSVLARCRLTLELFSRMFLDSVGSESKSILYELGGFEVREMKFRKDMERIRASQTADLHLNVERNRDTLIQQTFKQINQQAKRRAGCSQPLSVLRVKVQFENEPGEGTGVARSFYTAIAEALLSSDRLPSLEGVLPGANVPSHRKSSSMHLSLVARLYKREREREERSNRTGSSRTSGATATSSGNSERSINLRSFLTARYRELATGGRRDNNAPTTLSTEAAPFEKQSGSSDSAGVDRNKQAIGERLFPKVTAMNPRWSGKITGMLLQLPPYEVLLLLRSERSLHERVSEAADLLLSSGYSNDADERRDDAGESKSASSGEHAKESQPNEKQEDKASKPTSKDEEEVGLCEESDGGPPLFYQPGKRGMYAPAWWGDNSELRLNAYRNVGRLIGLCLLQNELFPLPLCRHVLKVLLGRKVHWHDLAFFDPVLYESLRQLVVDSESGGDDVLEAVDLTFLVDLQDEEGGGQVELIPGGASILVTKDNLMDYIRRYALYRMLSCCKRQLERMRQGLFDVLPRSALHNLTAEDLRLLFNGCGQVDVHALISYTMFNDESGKSGSSAEKLTQFKRWFWSVVDKLTQVERQDLLYFWTGSPALPASEDGFQPMPTITIRPPDDHHLPTANTCISRLYVPLYSTKHILRQKLLIAIKTKNFGFV